MNDPIQRAARDAIEAADNTDQLKLIAAVLQAQQLLNTQQQPQCQHPVPQPQFDARKWLVVGGVCIAGGLVASLFAVAVAIGSVSVAILALVLRSMWRDFQKGR